ncbi:hypothetical protein HETIRDRAFT_390334 [Heterobasidion irregulare TC 32-1]|uniref:C2H2-type domain-containing protein n=1 Tax=Heterobasidion irregulare (strain TC 32-1) TaxID=747525 RepID=W4JR15_HETIT|nr:uncharacterized protein HETIRDRAFT_390334 [Heterobasidion irregulare TC 32-1]ETW75904.1 hypothetical protein HETIRDRAFT_390334 [Heterobasidion irregulare TC 32-1]
MSQDLESFTASDRYSLCRAYVYLCTLFPKPSPSFPVIHAGGESDEEPAGFSVSSPTSSQYSSATSTATSSPSPASPSSLESPALPNDVTLPPASQDLSKVATASATCESRNLSPSPDLPSRPRSAYNDVLSQPEVEDAYVAVQHMPQSTPPTSYSTPCEMPVVSSTSLGKRQANNIAWYPSKSRRTEDMCMPKQVLLTALPETGLSRFPGTDEHDEGHALDTYNHISGDAAHMEQFHAGGLVPDNVQLLGRGPFPSPLSQAPWLTEDWAWKNVPQMSYHQFFDAIAPASHDGPEGHYDVTETTQSMLQMFEAGFHDVPPMFEAEEFDSELETYEGRRSSNAAQEGQYDIQQTFCGGQQAFFNETETAYDDRDSQSDSLQIFGDASETFYPSIQSVQSVLDDTLLNDAQENGYDALPIHHEASRSFENIEPTPSAAEYANGDVAQFDVPQFVQDALHPFRGVPQGVAKALPIVVPPPPNPRRNQTPYLSGEHNCHPCRLGFNARGDVARHEGTAKHDRRMRQLNPNAESKLRLAWCNVCGGAFANAYTVSKHKATQHVESV